MLKIDLHTHSADDPYDRIPYSTCDLIDRASDLGFDAIAVTLHDRQLDLADVKSYARKRGVMVISGVERTIAGRHILLLNFPAAAESVVNFDEIRQLKTQHRTGLVVAPHPFFPHGNSLRDYMDGLADLIDAVEVNAFFTATFDFNRRAVQWARRHHKPLIANSDVHRLPLLGRTYSLVQAGPTPDEICAAVKTGRIDLRTEPISIVEAAVYFGSLAVAGLRRPTTARPTTGLAPSADPLR
jgi:predicted metal-dependent phosphoesterase TrpH